ncbi:MAG: amidase [Xanthomonadales bacterium]|nr:amidase [Xanthomonadales bacterium]
MPGDPADLDAAAAAEALAAGTLSARELTAACLARIADDHHRAWLHVDAEGALAQARASDERRAHGRAYHPLDGLPVAVKDNLAVAGMPLTAGMAAHRGRVAAEDAHAVHKLRRSGAVILGKTHLCEAALGADADNPHFGRCLHPGHPQHSAGGSSSGSAVALALRHCPLALGSDSMGSLRIPAAHCGVVALKPSAARVSQRGLVTVSRRLDHVGPMARRVQDLALVFQQISGLDAQDPHSHSVPLAHGEHDPEALRIGVLQGLDEFGVSDVVATAFEAAVQRLAPEWRQRVDIHFERVDLGRWRRAGLLLAEAEMSLTHAQILATRPDTVSPSLRAMLDYASSRSAVDLVGALRRLDEAVLLSRRVFAQVDVLLLPTTPLPPHRIDQPEPASQADLTAFANFAGVPALTLPMGQDPQGVPLGMQLLGPGGSDLQLLALGTWMQPRLQ